MVKTEKDERKVEVGENDVVFTYENQQRYTLEQARNVYVNLLRDLKKKNEIIAKFSDIQKQADIEYDKVLEQQVEVIKRLNPKMSMVDIVHWKEVSRILNGQQIKEKLQALKKDIYYIEEGLKIWDKCKDLPETEYEKTLKEKNEI